MGKKKTEEVTRKVETISMDEFIDEVFPGYENSETNEKKLRKIPDITKPYDNINPNLSPDVFEMLSVSPNLLDKICHHIENNSDMMVVKVFRGTAIPVCGENDDSLAMIATPHETKGRILLANFINWSQGHPCSLLMLQVGESAWVPSNTLDERLIKRGCPLYLVKDFEEAIQVLDRIKANIKVNHSIYDC